MTMHHVHDGDDLQAVIDAAQPGDVVKVHPGTYDNIVMRSGVSVEGATPSGTFKWGVTGPMYDDVGMPCLVVTGDLDAARRRLAPLPADTRTAALDVATAAEGEWRFGVNNDRRNLREAIVDALVAAGLIRPAHDDAAYVAMREEFCGSVGALHSEACVVVTGRTAQETREAFELLDNRNRIFPGCVRDA